MVGWLCLTSRVCVCLFERTNVCLYINVEDYH